ncbi:MAG: hypothetical protein LQ337_007282 [Flavoplaca oasis]|nr:MAG: hypothetical protein LQ337_007282 [Flavoplaca oasis]
MASCGKVLAAGFNLHSQLKPWGAGNLHHFTQIQTLHHVEFGKDRVIAYALWSATIINTGRLLVHRGISGTNPDQIHFDELIDTEGKPKRGVFFGDVSGVRGFLDDEAGDLYILQGGGNNDARFIKHAFPADAFLSREGKKIVGIAIAGNMNVCIALCSKKPGVFVFSNLDSLLQNSDPVESYTSHDVVKGLIASSTTFTTLGYQQARVETFGDPRYPALLGRIPSTQFPASHPTVISALEGIKIAKIAAGRWLIAALSHQKDLYVWGHRLQQPVADDYSCFKGLLDTNAPNGTPEDVHLIDIAGSQDVEDVAVGDEHLVVLTTTGELWGYGSNECGQLGLGRDVKTTQGEWVKVYSPDPIEKIQVIAAGPLNTFVVVGCHDQGEQTCSDTLGGNSSNFVE